MHDLARLALDLVDIRSVSRQERRVTAWIADRVAALTHLRTVHRQDDAVVFGPPGRLDVVLAGHSDTVPEQGAPSRRAGRGRGDVRYPFRPAPLPERLNMETTAVSPSPEELRARIEGAYESGAMDAEAVEEAIRRLDRGDVRSAEPRPEGWVVNEWVKKAILLYFRLRGTETIEVGPFEYRDKIPLKHDLEASRVRVVPPAVARYGSFLAEDVIMMPSYVNIGAWVGPGTMVDTWATVGSCAQIGARVHLSGGVGIGGVLEPVQARPVIVEDDCFIASRCIVTEGVIVGARAVLGANVVLTGSTPVIDVTGPEPVEHRGTVPPGAVVVPGSRTKRFPAGEFQVTTGLIVGWRSEGTDRKLTLEDALREHGIAT